MKDYPRFVLRGGGAGAVVAFSAVIYFWVFFAIAIFYHPVSLVYMTLPGAVVGLVLCSVAGNCSNPLTPAKRFAIGTGAVAVLATAGSIYRLSTDQFAREYGIEYWIVILRILISAAAIGGLAGLACPASREHAHDEPKLSYRERTRLYEAAEREAQENRERIAQSDRQARIQVDEVHPRFPL